MELGGVRTNNLPPPSPDNLGGADDPPTRNEEGIKEVHALIIHASSSFLHCVGIMHNEHAIRASNLNLKVCLKDEQLTDTK